MSLIRCPECKRKISDAAEYCPQCGAPAGQMLRDAKAKKAEMKSKRRKNMLWLIIALAVLFYLGFKEEKKDIIAKPSKTITTKAATQATTKTSPPKASHQNGLGISYPKAIGQLDRYFNMEKRTLADNRTVRTGLTSDKTATLEYLGSHDNLTQAWVMIGIPKNNDSIIERNIAIVIEFMGNLFPDWRECGKWTLDALTKVAKTHQSLIKSKADRQIEVKVIKPFGMLTITVTKPGQPDKGVIIDVG